MKPGIRKLILEVLEEYGFFYLFHIYRTIRKEYSREVKYSTIRWHLSKLVEEVW